jgi:hypothetical protein
MLHDAMQEIYSLVCVAMAGFTLGTLMTQCATCVQPHPALEPNQSQPGEGLHETTTT